jgi:hypothetical protein
MTPETGIKYHKDIFLLRSISGKQFKDRFCSPCRNNWIYLLIVILKIFIQLIEFLVWILLYLETKNRGCHISWCKIYIWNVEKFDLIFIITWQFTHVNTILKDFVFTNHIDKKWIMWRQFHKPSTRTWVQTPVSPKKEKYTFQENWQICTHD